MTSLLGATQHDIAMLLGISRSQWAMYETGKRDLPLHATQLLAEMLAHLQSPERKTASDPVIQRQQAAQRKHLEQLLRENEFQQLLIARKIDAAAKKHEAGVRLLQLANFVEQRHKGDKGETFRFNTVAHKATFKDSALEITELTNHQIKKEILELENLVLQSKLRKLTSSIENKENI